MEGLLTQNDSIVIFATGGLRVVAARFFQHDIVTICGDTRLLNYDVSRRLNERQQDVMVVNDDAIMMLYRSYNLQ